MDHIGEHRRQDAALEERLRQGAGDEEADGLALGDDHGDLDAALLRHGSGIAAGLQLAHALAQIAGDILDNPAPVDVQRQLQQAMDEGNARIDGAEHDDEVEGAMLDRIVDDAALQLQGHDLDQEDHHRQDQEQDLVPAGGLPDIGNEVGGKRAGKGHRTSDSAVLLLVEHAGLRI